MRGSRTVLVLLSFAILSFTIGCDSPASNGDSTSEMIESTPAQGASSSTAFTEETIAGGVVVKLLDESCRVVVDEYGSDYAKGTKYFNIGYSVKNTNPFPVYVGILGMLDDTRSGSSAKVLSEVGTDFSSETFNNEFFGLWFAETTRSAGQFPCSDVDVSIELIVHRCIGCRADGSWHGSPGIQDCLTLRCATLPSSTTTTAPHRSSSGGGSIDTGDWIITYQGLGVVTQRLRAGDWIAVVASIDDSMTVSQKRSAVSVAVEKLHARSVDGPGNILRSSDFPGLKPGYIVVFAGPYSSSQAASGFCTMAGLQVPADCYPRSPIP